MKNTIQKTGMWIIALIPNNPLIDRALCLLFAMWRNKSFWFLCRPSSFNGFLVRRVLDGYLTDPLVRKTTDKLKYKEYVTQILGPGYVPETFFSCSIADFCSHDFDAFPGPCVVKNVLGSGDAKIYQTKEAWAKRAWHVTAPYSRLSRQENYIGEERLVVEELLGDSRPPDDFKFFIFDGRVKLIQVDLDRHTDHRRVLFSPDWERLPFNLHYPVQEISVPAPEKFCEMLEIASAVGECFSHVRVDLYSVGGRIYVGEMTHFHGGGGERVVPSAASGSLERLLFY